MEEVDISLKLALLLLSRQNLCFMKVFLITGEVHAQWRSSTEITACLPNTGIEGVCKKCLVKNPMLVYSSELTNSATFQRAKNIPVMLCVRWGQKVQKVEIFFIHCEFATFQCTQGFLIRDNYFPVVELSTILIGILKGVLPPTVHMSDNY